MNNVSAEQIVANRHFMHGSGIAIGDIDGDDRPDVYVARLHQSNVLYRNQGNLRFADITEASGVALEGYHSTGAALVDLDGDGDLDLLVTMLYGPGAVMLNDGKGRFSDFTSESGLASSLASTTMTLADVDGDRDLDIYIARYKRIALKDSLPSEAITWEVVMQDTTYAVKAPFADHYRFSVNGTRIMRTELAEPDGLYLNDGTGRFALVSWTGGVFTGADGTPLNAAPKDWALTARFYDINGDGHPDLYVCNDFEGQDALWLGDGQGNFRLAGADVLRSFSNATMSVDFADIDRDGHVDMFMTDMLSQDHARRQRQRNTRIPIPIPIGDLDSRPQEMQNMLFVSRGDGTFAQIAHMAGVAASDWSWSTSFVDVDLDGFEDLLITTGHAFDIQDLDAQGLEQQRLSRVQGRYASRALLLDFPPLRLPNVAFRNRGDRTFESVSDGWGLGRGADVSHGMALGDLDLDGDLDVVINRLNETVGLYENVAAAPRLAVQLSGPPGNSHGVGATISVDCPGLPSQTKEITAGGQYVSASQMMAVFAASLELCRISVTWQDRTKTTVPGALAGRLYEVAYPHAATDQPAPAGPPVPVEAPAPAKQPATMDRHGVTYPGAKVRSALPNGPYAWAQSLLSHHEMPYDDFARQPLLPHRLSQRGPGLALADLDGDGDDDMLLGSGMGRGLTTYYNEGGLLRPGAAAASATGDLTGIIVVPGRSSRVQVMAGVSNYERTPQTAGDDSYIQVFEIAPSGPPVLVQRLPFGEEAIGPLAAADVDGDSDLDLFAGGSFVPGAFPAAASSRIYRNTEGTYVRDADLSVSFERIGLVSGAAFGDLDADGDADLVLALQWGSLKVMMNEAGTFVDQTDALGLAGYAGRWNGVALGDFDEDGHLDIAATNWGWNTRYGSRENIRLYYGDVDANGILDIFEAFQEPTIGAYAPSRQLGDLAQGVPSLLRRYSSHAAFASSSIAEMLADAWHELTFVQASWLGSTIFLNRQTHFESRLLPQEAQHTVASGVAVLDANADGHLDLVLSQNYFALSLTTPRQDAGRGLWLAGRGDGSFAVYVRAGFTAYGEGRAVAAADFDQDGRSDVLIAQNGAPPHYYVNQAAQAGLRVRLTGPAANPWAIGTVVRAVRHDGTSGPANLVSAGSGYWSQDSRIVVLGGLDAIAAVHVQWPGGLESVVPVRRGAREVRATYPD